MKKVEVKKVNREWYVKVRNEDGTLYTQASFSTKKVANEVRKHWIEAKTFGEAEAV